MDLDKAAPAIRIIQEAFETWPVTFRSEMLGAAEEDVSYAYTHRSGPVQDAILARSKAVKRALEAAEGGNIYALREDIGGGIVALCVACNLLMLPRSVRTAAAVAQWGDKE